MAKASGRVTKCGHCGHSVREVLDDTPFCQSDWHSEDYNGGYFHEINIPDYGSVLACPKCGCVGVESVWRKEG